MNEIQLSRIDLNLLVLFEAVLQERHVGRAAARMNLSPSAVSHGLGRLRHLLNDPLFLRTPKGVVPTARAAELSEQIADILSRVRTVVASAESFDPATSRRRFTIGAPDGISGVFLLSLLDDLRQVAPGIDISLKHVIATPARVWTSTLAELEAGAMDIIVVPSDDIPARFAEKPLYEDGFVIGMRAGHSFADEPSLENFCAQQHLVVSITGDPHGFMDQMLGEQGLSRRVALTVPNFMFALAVIAGTDLVCALPRSFAATHGWRFGIICVDAPVQTPRFAIRAVVPKVALMDAGLAWLFDMLGRAASESRPPLGSLGQVGQG